MSGKVKQLETQKQLYHKKIKDLEGENYEQLSIIEELQEKLKELI